jgi:hypothetical protein
VRECVLILPLQGFLYDAAWVVSKYMPLDKRNDRSL